jgi:hypothetical protein
MCFDIDGVWLRTVNSSVIGAVNTIPLSLFIPFLCVVRSSPGLLPLRRSSRDQRMVPLGPYDFLANKDGRRF